MTNNSTSILGDSLDVERLAAFQRRFGYLYLQRGQLTRSKDRQFVDSLKRQLAAARGTFSPSLEQFMWLTDIEARLRGMHDFSGIVDDLLATAERAIEAEALPSGRLLQLVRLVDQAQLRELKRGEIATLQFLALEAGRGWQDDAV